MGPDRRISVSYSVFYFIVYLEIAYGLAFFSLNCRDLGFTPFQIAFATAAMNLSSLVGAPFFTAAAYSILPARRIFQLSMAASFLLTLPLAFVSSYPVLASLWILHIVLSGGFSVMLETQAMRDSTSGVIRYERVRLWGSLGFVVGLALCGEILDAFGANVLRFFPLAAMILTVLSAGLVLSRFNPRCGEAEAADRNRSRTSAVFANRTYLWLLAVILLIWASHGTAYVYLSIYLQAWGWTGRWISAAWNIGVLAEVLVFWSFTEIQRHVRVETILQWSAMLTVLRWLLLAVPPAAPLVLTAQLLHGASFAAISVASLKWIYRELPVDLRERAQGIFFAVGNGFGSLGGRLLCGLIAPYAGGDRDLNALFLLSAAMALVASLLALRKLGGSAKAAAF